MRLSKKRSAISTGGTERRGAVSATALKLAPPANRKASGSRWRSLTGRGQDGVNRSAQMASNLPIDALQTHAEKALGAFVQPFSLSSLEDAVHGLIGAGYSSPSALQAVDERALQTVGPSADDSERILLATWLQTAGLVQYGRGLVASGCSSRLQLLALTDEQMKGAGMEAIGHRRLLQRQVRESEEIQLQAEAARRREAERKGRLRGLSGGLSKKQELLHVPETRGPDAALSAQAELPRYSLEPVFGPPDDGRALGALPKWDDWAAPWRTVSNASLRTTPGAWAETHYAAPLNF